MRYLLLLCAPLVIASEMCSIQTTTSFNNHQRQDLVVYLTNPQNGIYDSEIGSLFSYFFVKQTDMVKPNSDIYHEYSIQSTKNSEFYTIKERIRLKGCNIELVNIESDDVESNYDYDHDSVYVSYKLVTKTQKEGQPFNQTTSAN